MCTRFKRSFRLIRNPKKSRPNPLANRFSQPVGFGVSLHCGGRRSLEHRQLLKRIGPAGPAHGNPEAECGRLSQPEPDRQARFACS